MCWDGFLILMAQKGLQAVSGFFRPGFEKMAIYMVFIILWKWLHVDVRRAAKFYRWVFMAALIAFAAFMWTLDIKLVMDS